MLLSGRVCIHWVFLIVTENICLSIVIKRIYYPSITDTLQNYLFIKQQIVPQLLRKMFTLGYLEDILDSN